LPEPDPDEQMTLDVLRAAGFDASMLAWNGDQGPEGFDAVVLRSTWDYYLSPDEFRSWLLRVDSSCRLFNPLAVVLSNLHKSYLFALESRSVPVVPTVLVPRGTSYVSGGIDESSGLVVKPAVGASSWKTRVFRSDALAGSIEYVQVLVQDMDVLVQPFLSSVERGGERSLVWIDGEFTHKIVKRPRFEGSDESVSAAEPLTGCERESGESAVAAYMDWIAGEQPLYARVDVMETDDGRTVVSEVEMTEPSLYFLQEPRALDRFVAGIRARLA
jgi:hypothetical protein